jgi:hypothetical protein
MLAADNWCVKVEERIYGPYSSQQLRKYAHEGRFAPSSLVAPAGSRAFKEARLEPVFSSLFGTDARPDSQRTFGRRAEPEPAETDKDGGRKPKLARKPEGLEPSVANFVIIFDVVSAAASRAESAIQGLGPSFRLNDNVWTLTCEMTALGVRNAIAPYLMPRDSILVVDATRGRTSWQNFGPEIHAKLAAAWSGARQ